MWFCKRLYGKQGLLVKFEKLNNTSMPVIKKYFFCLLSYIILSTTFFNSLIAQSGEIVFTRTTKENGLAADLIHAVIKDRQGYYWVSSVNGLQRFDGYKWVNFRHDGKDSASLPDNAVYQLMEDNQGRLWLNAGGYPCIYNPLHRNFRKIPVDYPGKKPFNIYSLFQDSKGRVWMVSGPQGLFVLDTIKNIFRPYSTVWPSLFSKAFGLVEDAKGRYWLATDKGCVVYDSKSKTYLNKKNNPDSFTCLENEDFLNNCGYVYLDKNQILWTHGWSSEKGPLVFRYDINKNEFSPVKYYTNTAPTKLLTDQSGTTWAYYGTILARYDEKLKGLIEMPPTRNSLYGIDFNIIYNMYEDVDGTIWVMSDLGLYNFNPRLQYFTTLKGVWSFRGKKKTDPGTSGFIQTRSGHILSIGGNDDGIIFYDSTFNQLNPLYGYNTSDKKLLPFIMTWCGLQDSKGIIWVGCQVGGIIQLNPTTHKVSTLMLPEFEGHTIRSIKEDTEGNIWFGTQHSTLVKWERSANKFHKIISLTKIKEDFAWILSMVMTGKDDLWMSSFTGGLLHVNRSTGKIIEQFQHDETDPASISSDYTKAIVLLNRDTLAIGTEKGIDLFSISKKTFSHISENDGLPGGGIFSMIADDKGNLWFTTVDGIAKIHLPDKRIHKYGSPDGVIEKDFQYGAAIRLKDGRIVFGNTRGLVYFNPATINEAAVPSDVTVTGFSISDIGLSADSLFQNSNKIRLRYFQNSIAIRFSSLGNCIYNKPVYYYMLEGINKDWVATQNPEAVYSYLPSGTYTFKVKCISPDGVPSKNITSFTIYIRPPFYKTWWFYTLCTLLIAVIIYTIYRIRIQRMMALEKVRARIASDLHDDMGSALSTINILSTMAKTKVANDPVTTSDYISKISENSSTMMEAMSDIVWSINPLNDSMQKIVARMREFAATVLEPKNIDYDFYVDEKVFNIKTGLEEKKDLFLIFKEAVNNLAKYSACKKAWIELKTESKRLSMLIKDDGKGFDLSSADNGNGMHNMRKRAAALKGKITIESEMGKGSTVLLQMPIT